MIDLSYGKSNRITGVSFKNASVATIADLLPPGEVMSKLFSNWNSKLGEKGIAVGRRA
jgi:hypothetical protein